MMEFKKNHYHSLIITISDFNNCILYILLMSMFLQPANFRHVRPQVYQIFRNDKEHVFWSI